MVRRATVNAWIVVASILKEKLKKEWKRLSISPLCIGKDTFNINARSETVEIRFRAYRQAAESPVQITSMFIPSGGP
jgi:hypothetical protein